MPACAGSVPGRTGWHEKAALTRSCRAARKLMAGSGQEEGTSHPDQTV